MTNRRDEIMQAAVRVIASDGVRGLRVGKLAAEAGVSVALIYYHFDDRDGLLHAALEYINNQARTYTQVASTEPSARKRLQQTLIRELQDTDEVRTNSIAWGELRSSAVFNAALRDSLRAATDDWDTEIEYLVQQVVPSRENSEAAAIASRLTALVEGLSQRWHSGSIALAAARRLLGDAIDTELPSDSGSEGA